MLLQMFVAAKSLLFFESIFVEWAVLALLVFLFLPQQYRTTTISQCPPPPLLESPDAVCSVPEKFNYEEAKKTRKWDVLNFKTFTKTK